MGLAEELVSSSSLTKRQMECLISYTRVALGEIRLREAADLVSQGRTKGNPSRPTTVGSYYRTVGQARKNIRRSMATMFLGIWLGLVRSEDVKRLLDLAAGGQRDLVESEVERFLDVLGVLLDRMVL